MPERRNDQYFEIRMNVLRWQQALKGILLPISAVYEAVMGVRRFFWEKGVLRRLIPNCPCISVGNIAWGGTGKTPLVDWLMHWAEGRGVKTVVLTRGYKAEVAIAPAYVKAYNTAREVGDEPLMLALDHPDSAVLVDANRRRAGRYAMRSLEPELFLLDDGFQHLAVSRHVDLVVLRPEDLGKEWGKIIPAGSWREGPSALRRATAFLVKTDRAGMEALLPAFQERLAGFQKPVFSFDLHPVRLEEANSGRSVTAASFGGRPYVLVSGVGNPGHVEDVVTRFLGHAPEHHFQYADHYPFEFKDAKQFGALGYPVVCTAKDAVKLRQLPLSKLWILRVEVRFGAFLWSQTPFPVWLETWWNRQNAEGAVPSLETGEPWSGFVATAGLVEPPASPDSKEMLESTASEDASASTVKESEALAVSSDASASSDKETPVIDQSSSIQEEIRAIQESLSRTSEETGGAGEDPLPVRPVSSAEIPETLQGEKAIGAQGGGAPQHGEDSGTKKLFPSNASE